MMIFGGVALPLTDTPKCAHQLLVEVRPKSVGFRESL